MSHRKVRQDQGEQWSLSEPLRRALCAQHRAHKRWSYQLHWDNLRALADRDKTIGDVPAYSTIRRYMKAHGMFPKPRRGDPNLPGVQRAEQHLEAREVRSYEAGHPNALWHLDFHTAKRQVLNAKGAWVTPHLLGILDDQSHLCCHLQWYFGETAAALVHALMQAFQKRGLPRSLLTAEPQHLLAPPRLRSAAPPFPFPFCRRPLQSAETGNGKGARHIRLSLNKTDRFAINYCAHTQWSARASTSG